MLCLLLVITISFMALNLVLHEMDYMHPSFLFSLVFFVYTFMCVLCRAEYEIALHWYTVFVIFLGLMSFTFVGALSKGMRARFSGFGVRKEARANSWHHAEGYQAVDCANRPAGLQKIHISNWIVIGCILLQLVTIYAFRQYLHNLTVAFNATQFALDNGGKVSETSLTAQIDLFDTLTKFWTKTYNSLNVPFPMLYRLGNPLTTAAAYILIYIVVNNFIADRSINVLHLVSIGLLCVLIIMNGSRSPLFRVITMVLILAYVLNVKNGTTRLGDRKLFLKIAMVVLAAGAGFVLLLNLMGRTDDTSAKIGRYLFIYLGAPIVNLDTFLAKHFTSFDTASYGYLVSVNTSVSRFGALTFGALYSYGAKLLGISLESVPSIMPFAFSANDIEIGNVYTMFATFIYDFGYGGVVPLTMLVGFYYVHSYDRIMDDIVRAGRIRPHVDEDCVGNTNGVGQIVAHDGEGSVGNTSGVGQYVVSRTRDGYVGGLLDEDMIDFRLFIYAYLFNDLIMSAFSCRFFQTALDAPFLKLLLVSWIYDLILFRRRLHLGRYSVELTATNYRDTRRHFTLNFFSRYSA